MVLFHAFEGAATYNCAGSNFGEIEVREITQNCSTQSCPTWSVWAFSSDSDCSRTCGGGYREETSLCLDTQGFRFTTCPGKIFLLKWCFAIHIKLRSHRIKPRFHHCIVFASWEKNCCKEADLL